MRCLVTGCALYSMNHSDFADEGSWVWGDLHEVGDCYVFNACLDQRGDANWQEGVPDPARKYLVVSTTDYFDRRGVIVLPKSKAILNLHAQEYLK